jgi:hypothetical protein
MRHSEPTQPGGLVRTMRRPPRVDLDLRNDERETGRVANAFADRSSYRPKPTPQDPGQCHVSN